MPRRTLRVVLSAMLVTVPSAVRAQTSSCRMVCTPTITLMPAVLRSHLFGGPLVQTIASGNTHRLPGTSNFELILAAAMKTALPRTSVFYSVQWLPNAAEARNPFTLYTANELGGSVRANAPTMTLGVSLSAVTAKQTHGVVDLDGNVADLYSQAARPDDRSAYTHKLDLELVTHWHILDWTPAQTYAHRITLFGILDYVATGLPRAGDEVPKGRRFLENARPTSLIVGLALPLSPEVK